MTSWPLWGTVVNTVAVLLGALCGLAIKALAGRAARKHAAEDAPALQEERPSRLKNLPAMIQKGLGLCVVLIGLQGAITTTEILIVILSMVLGIIVGELCDLDGVLYFYLSNKSP